MARPTEYNEEILTKCREYLDSCEDTEEDYTTSTGMKSESFQRLVRVKIPTIEGLAVFLKINKTTIYEWESKHEEFSNVIGELRSIQAERLINKGLSGDYNPTIAKVLLTKHGYRDAVDTDITSKGEKLEASDPKAIALAKEYEDKLKTGI